MSKMFLLIAFLTCMKVSYTQTEKSNTEVSIQNVKSDLKKIIKDLEVLSADVKRISSSSANNSTEISQINSRVKILTENVDSENISLENKINQTSKKSKNEIDQLGGDVVKNRLYWIIATLLTLLLGVLMYLFLGKRIKSSQTDVETQIRSTKKTLEEESLKLDAQLLEIINSQLKIKEAEPKKPESGEKDHSLVLKVADEVTRILMNLEVMDKEIKGYKQLKKYSESILDNLKAYGYEIPQLIGMNYNSGMNMDAKLELDESVEIGKQIIKRIIKPQVNYDGKMIQAAKVTVVFNE